MSREYTAFLAIMFLELAVPVSAAVHLAFGVALGLVGAWLVARLV